MCLLSFLFSLFFTASRSDKKLQLQINGVNLDRCDEIYQRHLGLKLSRNQLCAGGEEGKDSCSGDSGKYSCNGQDFGVLK